MQSLKKSEVQRKRKGTKTHFRVFLEKAVQIIAPKFKKNYISSGGFFHLVQF